MRFQKYIAAFLATILCLIPTALYRSSPVSPPLQERALPSYVWSGKITCTPPADMRLLYFRDTTDTPQNPADYGMERELTRIYQTVLQCYYAEFLAFDAENLPPRTDEGNSYVDVLKVYDFRFRDDLFVLANEEIGNRTRCYPFIWKDNTLSHFDLDGHTVDGARSVREFRLVYRPDPPCLFAEIADYSNRGNGFYEFCDVTGSEAQTLLRYGLSGGRAQLSGRNTASSSAAQRP